MDELTGGRGTVFATGTPVSNSMVELYTMQPYLQYDTLREKGLLHFDAWASTFRETVTQNELAPEGKGYRPRTMAIDGLVIHLDTADVRELVRVLRVASNSLIQLTKRVHETGSIYG